MADLRTALRELPEDVAIDLFRGEDAYLLVVDLPGATSDNTRLETDDDTLTVTSERDTNLADTTTVIEEQRPTRLGFELPVPADVDTDEIAATLSDGVLELTLPRGLPGTPIPIEDE